MKTTGIFIEQRFHLRQINSQKQNKTSCNTFQTIKHIYKSDWARPRFSPQSKKSTNLNNLIWKRQTPTDPNRPLISQNRQAPSIKPRTSARDLQAAMARKIPDLEFSSSPAFTRRDVKTFTQMYKPRRDFVQNRTIQPFEDLIRGLTTRGRGYASKFTNKPLPCDEAVISALRILHGEIFLYGGELSQRVCLNNNVYNSVLYNVDKFTTQTCADLCK